MDAVTYRRAAFMFGGIAVTTEGQVVNISGHPIQVFCGVGKIVGIFHHNHPPCSGQTHNAMFALRTTGHALGSNTSLARA